MLLSECEIVVTPKECRICGLTDKVVSYYRNKRLTMCDGCAIETPDKLSRNTFDYRYWGKGYQDVPDGIRAEFYSDYVHGVLAFDEYIRTTTEEV